MIDASSFVQILADNSPILWSKYKDIIEEQRRLNDNPELYIGFEILAKEVDNYCLSKGLKSKMEAQSRLGSWADNP
ncbi:hypothetical protein ACFL0D_07595 [Thermoproteota archaeon]